MYTAKEIKIANSTARSNGTSVYDKDGNIRSIVAKYIEKNISKEKRILDYGCGPNFIQGKYLNSIGFNVDGYDFGKNIPENCADIKRNKYDVIYASNVLNVQSSLEMLYNTLNEINNALEYGGIFIYNYPASPRKLGLTNKEMHDIVNKEIKMVFVKYVK